MISLSKEQIKHLHEMMVDKTGGLYGIRDEGLLESALASPFQTFGGEELYPGVISKIARISYGIVKNHPFLDGNKRTGTYVMLALLELNNINADFTDEDIVKIGLNLANGSLDDAGLLEIILQRSK